MSSHTLSGKRILGGPETDLGPLEARTTALEADAFSLESRVTTLETPPARVLGGGTPIAGPTATSWSNAITVTADGFSANYGDASILIGDDWCMCFLILEGTAVDSSSFGDVDVFKVNVTFPDNVAILQGGTPSFDSNMLSGFGSAVDATLATNLWAPCAVVSDISGVAAIRGKWVNRVGDPAAQIAVFFLARTSTTPALSRHFNGIARQSLAPDALEAPQITQPENYDYIDVEDPGYPGTGCRIGWCHGTAGVDQWIISPSAPFSATTAYGASIPITGWFPALGTKNQGVIYDHVGFTRGTNELAMNNQFGLTGTAEYRAAFFLPDTNTKVPYTTSLSSDGTATLNTTNGNINYYWRFDQYVFISTVIDVANATYVDIDVPGTLPVSTGCQIIGSGYGVSARLATPWLLANGTTIRMYISVGGGVTPYSVLIVYHTSAP